MLASTLQRLLRLFVLFPGAVFAERVPQLVAGLSLSEKLDRLHGNGWDSGLFTLPFPFSTAYGGELRGLPRLQIPALRLNDGPQGWGDATPWRYLLGHPTATMLPSNLALGATWSRDTARVYGAALAAEFADKGADVILGPGLNLHRVPWGGRNFEYLRRRPLSRRSPRHRLRARRANRLVGFGGEAPERSRSPTTALVHKALFNNQELGRTEVFAQVPQQAFMELYRKPFDAAVEAGRTV